MKKNVFIFLLFTYIIIIAGCKSHSVANGMTETSDTVHFFPVNEYFKEQIKNVDNSAAFIYKITIDKNGNKRDSSVLSKQQFDEWARSFLEYDISDKSIHKYYKENIFMDETTRSYTFNYTTIDSSLPLQSVDVLLDIDDQHVKRVFINKVKSMDDSTITEKAGWKNNSSFFINRITSHPDNSTTEQQNIIVWNNQP